MKFYLTFLQTQIDTININIVNKFITTQISLFKYMGIIGLYIILISTPPHKKLNTLFLYKANVIKIPDIQHIILNKI